MADQSIVLLGVLLMLAGLLLAFIALVLPMARSGKLQGRGGAVIIVGPFPIVIGSDQRTTKLLLILAIILVIALTVLFLVENV